MREIGRPLDLALHGWVFNGEGSLNFEEAAAQERKLQRQVKKEEK